MNAMSLRILSGECDVDDFINAVTNTTPSRPRRRRKIQTARTGHGAGNRLFWFNENTNVDAKTGQPLVDPVKLKWFRNAKFRQACAYAIDREAIIKSIYSGRAHAELWLCDDWK